MTIEIGKTYQAKSGNLWTVKKVENGFVYCGFGCSNRKFPEVDFLKKFKIYEM